jgi:hypothetical protein
MKDKRTQRLIKKIVQEARYQGHLAYLVEKRGDCGHFYRDRAAGLMSAARIVRDFEKPEPAWRE